MKKGPFVKRKRENRFASPVVDQFLRSAIAQHQAGQLGQAEILYRKVLSIVPDHPDALHLLGAMAHQAGKQAIALELVDRALRSAPSLAFAYNTRGLVLQKLGRPEEALQSFNRAIRIKPDYAEAYCNRAGARLSLKQREAALHDFDKAILLKNDFVEAYYFRGSFWGELNEHQAALENFDKAILLKPDYFKAYHDRGVALTLLSRYREAVESFDRCIAIKPDLPEAYRNRGGALFWLYEYDAALKSYDKALQLNPEYGSAYGSRGFVFVELNRYLPALQDFDKALLWGGEDGAVRGERLRIKRFLGDWKDSESETKDLEEKVAQGESATTSFSFLSISGSPILQKKAAEIWTQKKVEVHSVVPIPRQPRHGKIRVGYFSADFREHAVSYLMAEVFERHDRDRFEIMGFSLGQNTADPMRTRISSAMDRFVDIQPMSDLDVVRLGREIGLDIAVDLTGYTQHNRTGIFARRVAPVQVNYIGYPGTMGAQFMDYLIADDMLIPESSRQHYTEKIVYMPDCFQANDSSRQPSSTVYRRVDLGLPEAGFVYCCFNNSCKFTPEVFDIWMRILRRVEGSVLWLLEGNPWVAESLRKEAAQRGVDPVRLVFARKLPLPEHLARQKVADLFLDTLPFNAGATASPALWAGLPLLTRTGESFAGRMGASLLQAIDLPELITTTAEAYEELAVELAVTPARIQHIKERLERNRLTTALFDIPRFTRNLESAYVSMYERSQANLPPDHIYVAKEQGLIEA